MCSVQRRKLQHGSVIVTVPRFICMHNEQGHDQSVRVVCVQHISSKSKVAVGITAVLYYVGRVIHITDFKQDPYIHTRTPCNAGISPLRCLWSRSRDNVTLRQHTMRPPAASAPGSGAIDATILGPSSVFFPGARTGRTRHP